MYAITTYTHSFGCTLRLLWLWLQLELSSRKSQESFLTFDCIIILLQLLALLCYNMVLLISAWLYCAKVHLSACEAT